MLFAPAVPVAAVSALSSVVLGYVIAPQVGAHLAWLWVLLSCAASLLRLLHLGLYLRSARKTDPVWLRGLKLVGALHGAAWGLVGLLMPVQDMVVSAVIVATLVGACAVATFTLQTDLRTNIAINVPMLVPGALMLLTRQDSYGIYGGVGLLALLSVMLFESGRAERRITELLWLRFTTDRIATERAEALKLAQRHSAVKDQFLATMSHEMRTPLHGILGLARLVQGRLPDRPGVLNESRHQLGLIERTGEHLLEIINDVLDFSRIEAGKLHVEHNAFDLCTVVQDVLSLLNVTAIDKGLKLRRDLRIPAPCWVTGDAARVRQVLHNLVGNAIKFTEVGEVRVCVYRQTASSHQKEGKVVITVDDTGEGIPADQLALIFDAFHQVDGSFGRKHTGTGLGLTISREIARAMDGDITCQSEVGRGTTFTLGVPLPSTTVQSVDLTLPIGEALVETAPAPLEPLAQGCHVLLAEDNAVNALVAEATLANLGMRVTRVENGHEALAALQDVNHGFDIVLMDCQMPVLDGIEATRQLRYWEASQQKVRVPVIALTANAMAGDRARCMAAGMDDHLAKPFRQDELSAVLRTHLGRCLAAARADTTQD
jgi:signal transduction histidine kinase/ActR/RegA family two-component response regulator